MTIRIVRLVTVLTCFASMCIALPQLEAFIGEAQTGKFGKGGTSAAPSLSITGIYQMGTGVIGMTPDSTGGSGPYKSTFGAVPGLARHTMYMPQNVPASMKLPVIVWGNGACSGNGAWFSKFLNEIASHGFFIVANGSPDGSLITGSKAQDMPDAIEWVYRNAGQGKFANVDKTKLAAAGQSCGGIQAYSASLDRRVTVTGIFNSGLLNEANTPYLNDLHAPVGYFLGGPTDIAYDNGERDYKNMPAKIPVIKANLPVGHMATYGSTNGGKFAEAATLFFQWQLKDDQAAGQQFLQPSKLKSEGWDIVSRGFRS